MDSKSFVRHPILTILGTIAFIVVLGMAWPDHSRDTIAAACGQIDEIRVAIDAYAMANSGECPPSTGQLSVLLGHLHGYLPDSLDEVNEFTSVRPRTLIYAGMDGGFDLFVRTNGPIGYPIAATQRLRAHEVDERYAARHFVPTGQ